MGWGSEEREREYEESEKERQEYNAFKKLDSMSSEERQELNDKLDEAIEIYSKARRPKKPTQKDWKKTIKAEHGFSGHLDEPTHFLVGEKGPERMYIDPKTDYLHIEPDKKKSEGFFDMDFDFTKDFKKLSNDDEIGLSTGIFDLVDKHGNIPIKSKKYDPFDPRNWD
jgi:hypothetical protein